MLTDQVFVFLGVTIISVVIFHLLFQHLKLRQRIPFRKQKWLLTIIILAFLLIGLGLMKLINYLDPTEQLIFLTHGSIGIYCCLWLASIPVLAPNSRWDS